MDPSPLDVTVVIATYNRLALLERLLGQLAEQSVAPDRFEVLVVDDGSREPVRGALAPRPFALRVEAQANSGPAVARDRGARTARGDLLVFVDDDMQVGPGFLAGHLAAHPPGARRVVLGRVRPPPRREDMALHERWHQHHLDRLAARSRAGEPLPGNMLYTGNLSLRRAEYLAVGGFDLGFRHVEDGELGLRLERAGLQLVVADDAYTVNNGDRPPPERWRQRAHTWGRHEVRIARKHPDLRHASPWRYLEISNALARPVLLGAALWPGAARIGASASYAIAAAADRRGLDRLAMTMIGLTYCLEFFRGVREEVGGPRDVLREATRFVSGPAGSGTHTKPGKVSAR